MLGSNLTKMGLSYEKDGETAVALPAIGILRHARGVSPRAVKTVRRTRVPFGNIPDFPSKPTKPPVVDPIQFLALQTIVQTIIAHLADQPEKSGRGPAQNCINGAAMAIDAAIREFKFEASEQYIEAREPRPRGSHLSTRSASELTF